MGATGCDSGCELYYTIANKSAGNGFAAGLCHTVGVGGHFSGGGVGFLVRKYGLAADNILDANMIDFNGKLLNRKSMGEDLFWALRGGGGASFGVITSYKIRLSPIPSVMTRCSTIVNLEQGLTKLVFKWQQIANKADRNLFLNIILSNAAGSKAGTRTINGIFTAHFLGRSGELLLLMKKEFPELGLGTKDCKEMKWIEAVKLTAGFPVTAPLDVLITEPSLFTKTPFKTKYDYAIRPISADVLKAIWEFMKENVTATLILDPLGGRMDEILEDEIPFPHRRGNLFTLQYLAFWQDEIDSEKSLRWVRRLYDYMGDHVSKSPSSS